MGRKPIAPLENPCQVNCMCCKIYKSVKEQNKLCESKRERGRWVNRTIYKAKKDRIKGDVSMS